jgi:hypothetical protein
VPEWKLEIRKRLAGLKLEPTRESEIVDELSQHLEDRYQELRAVRRRRPPDAQNTARHCGIGVVNRLCECLQSAARSW